MSIFSKKYGKEKQDDNAMMVSRICKLSFYDKHIVATTISIEMPKLNSPSAEILLIQFCQRSKILAHSVTFCLENKQKSGKNNNLLL